MGRHALSVYYFSDSDGDLKSRLERVGQYRAGRFVRRVSASAVARELILERLEQLEPRLVDTGASETSVASH